MKLALQSWLINGLKTSEWMFFTAFFHSLAKWASSGHLCGLTPSLRVLKHPPAIQLCGIKANEDTCGKRGHIVADTLSATTLKLLTERNKDFNGISRPALYFSTTCDTKSFLVGWYNSLTPSPWATWMDYPKWTTLKFVANMSLTMLEPGQKIRLINNHNYRSLVQCNRFKRQMDLCHKTLEAKISGSRGRILASCPFAAYGRVVGNYIRKISTYEPSVLSILWATLRLLCLLPALFWPAVEMQDGGVFG